MSAAGMDRNAYRQKLSRELERKIKADLRELSRRLAEALERQNGCVIEKSALLDSGWLSWGASIEREVEPE